MKSGVAAGGRVATKCAAMGRRLTCGQETGCQINQRGEINHPPCNSSGLGDRRPKGLQKTVVSGARGYEGGPQPPGFMVDASRVLQETVGMLSDTEQGAAIFTSGQASRGVASWKTRAASSSSEFVRVPSGFLSDISAAMMLGVQGCRHTRLVPDPDGFSHTRPTLIPEASQNPRW